MRLMMVHFPGHKRAAFTEWLEQGAPPRATIEENYHERDVSARTLLKRTLDCTDMLPRDARETVAGIVGYDGPDPGLNYGDAASILLVKDAVGPDGALAYMHALVEPVPVEEQSLPPWHQDVIEQRESFVQDGIVVSRTQGHDASFDSVSTFGVLEWVYDADFATTMRIGGSTFRTPPYGWRFYWERQPGEVETDSIPGQIDDVANAIQKAKEIISAASGAEIEA